MPMSKSGVAGGILLVVPNVMGVMCWSPPLDKLGNSVRGIQFCTDTPKLWGNTPMDEAVHFGHHDVVTILQDYHTQSSPPQTPQTPETAQNNLDGLL
ncbi:hypothetical protein CRUP_007311 [Coryphaenoides rupestris]|nr:hypothetical protein CRUP_007311 [Coryphaenoides rupestris]